ncbi:MAG: periplasmic heavy metal sensor [Candidatus Acidiferrales bacterium]
MNSINRRCAVATLALLASLAMALPARALQPLLEQPRQAQDDPPPPQGPPPPPRPGQRNPGPGGREGRPDNPSADMHMPPGRWWNDPAIVQSIGLSAAQIKKMDETFNGARDHLIDLDATVRKAEGGLQPLLDTDPVDPAKIMAQIERLTLAKAELEKANAQMLLDIRLQLTHDQWVKLAGLRPARPPER